MLRFLAATVSFASSALAATLALANASSDYDRAFSAMRADLTDPDAAFTFAVIATREGDISGAIAALEQVLRLDPDRDNIRADLGYLYLREGNPALAEQYLREALVSGSAPKVVEAQIDTLIAEAKAAQSPLDFDGTFVVGAQYETNASGGPDIAGFSTGGEEEDFSLVASASFDLTHDLGFQGGASLDLGLDLFTVQYGKPTSPETVFAGVDLGATLPLGEGHTLSPYLFANTLSLRGDPYRNAHGAGLRYEASFDPSARYRVDLRAADQSFKAIASSPNASEQDGTMVDLGLAYTRELGPEFVLALGVSVAQKEAVLDFESFSAAGADIRLNRNLEWSPFRATGRRSVLGLGLDFRAADYDAPDPFVDPDRDRRDTRFSAALSLQVPVTERGNLFGAVTWTENSSNYVTEEYDNLGIFLGALFLMDGSG